MNPVFVVSDDVTGCVDSGAIFLSGGCSVTVDVGPTHQTVITGNEDIIAYNMSSRTIPEIAAKKNALRSRKRAWPSSPPCGHEKDGYRLSRQRPS